MKESYQETAPNWQYLRFPTAGWKQYFPLPFPFICLRYGVLVYPTQQFQTVKLFSEFNELNTMDEKKKSVDWDILVHKLKTTWDHQDFTVYWSWSSFHPVKTKFFPLSIFKMVGIKILFYRPCISLFLRKKTKPSDLLCYSQNNTAKSQICNIF